MKRTTVLLVALPLAACASGQPTATSAPSAPPQLVMSGTVRTDDGIPLGNVEVYVVGLAAKATSNSDGWYSLEAHQPVMDRPTPVRATLPGFFPEQIVTVLGCHSIVHTPDEAPVCRQTIDFWLNSASPALGSTSACTVSGHILASRESRGIDGLVRVPGTALRTGADSTGAYRLGNVPSGIIEIEARSLGRHPHRRMLWVACDQPDLGPTLNFRLTDAVIE